MLLFALNFEKSSGTTSTTTETYCFGGSLLKIPATVQFWITFDTSLMRSQ